MKNGTKKMKERKCEVCGGLTKRKGKVALCSEHKEFEAYSGFN